MTHEILMKKLLEFFTDFNFKKKTQDKKNSWPPSHPHDSSSLCCIFFFLYKEKSGPLGDIKTKLWTGKSEKKQEAPTVMHKCIFG